jgi:hypothetical protein
MHRNPISDCHVRAASAMNNISVPSKPESRGFSRNQPNRSSQVLHYPRPDFSEVQAKVTTWRSPNISGENKKDLKEQDHREEQKARKKKTPISDCHVRVASVMNIISVILTMEKRMQPKQQEDKNGDGEGMWPGWTRRDGCTPRQFGAREQEEETEEDYDVDGTRNLGKL